MIAVLDSLVMGMDYSKGKGRLKKSVGETCCCVLRTAVAAVQPPKASQCARQAADLEGQEGQWECYQRSESGRCATDSCSHSKDASLALGEIIGDHL